MQISPELQAQFSAQITLEFSASLVYRQLAAEMDVQDLRGLAAWLRAQADEEVIHANKFIDHVVDRGGHPSIGSIDAPKVGTGVTAIDVFEAAFAHEQKVSESIRELYRASETAGDVDSRPLLNWFVEEQVEEEATVSEIVGHLKMIDGDGPGLLKLDTRLAKRASTGSA